MSMSWPLFTERARWAMVLAQESAQRYGNRSIEPDHIFVGIVEQAGSDAAEVVVAFGISAMDVRRAASKRMETGTAAGDIVFSEQARRVIELAFEESQRLQHNYVGTEHLLFGYLRGLDSENSILADVHVDPASLTAKVLESLEQAPKAIMPSINAPMKSPADSFGLLLSDIADDLERRYSPLMGQIAELFQEDESLFAFLSMVRVNGEAWNVEQARGYFFLELPYDYACDELIDLIADDADGATIEVSIHIAGVRTSGGEWHRLDGRAVLRWPPPSVLPKSRRSRRIR